MKHLVEEALSALSLIIIVAIAALILLVTGCGNLSSDATNGDCQDGYIKAADGETCVIADNVPRDSEGNPIDPTCPVDADHVLNKTFRIVDGCTLEPFFPPPLLDFGVADRALQRVSHDPSTLAFKVNVRSCVIYSICLTRQDGAPGQDRICWDTPSEALPSDDDFPILLATCE